MYRPSGNKSDFANISLDLLRFILSSSAIFGVACGILSTSFAFAQESNLPSVASASASASSTVSSSSSSVGGSTLSSATIPVNSSTLNVDNLAAPAVSKKVEFEVSLQSASSLQASPTDPDRKANSEIDIGASYKLSSDFTLSALQVISRDLTGFQDTTFENSQLSLIYKSIEQSRFFQASPRMSVTLPTNEVDRRESTYRGTVGLALREKFNFTDGGLPVDGFYQVGYSRSTHEFDRKGSGAANTEQSISNRLVATYHFVGRLSIMVDLRYRVAYTYGGSISESYDSAQEIDYDLSDATGIGIGHQLGGPLFKSDGVTSNLTAFNERESSIYANFVFRF